MSHQTPPLFRQGVAATPSPPSPPSPSPVSPTPGDEDRTNAQIFQNPLFVGLAALIFFVFFSKLYHISRRRAALRASNAASSPPQPPHSQADYHQNGPFAHPPSNYPSQTIHVPAQPRPAFPSARYILLTPELSTAPHFANVERSRARRRYNPQNLISFKVSDEEAKNPCAICLAPLEEEMVSSGQCLHFMHTSCLKNWLVKDVRSACPVCRVEFEDEEDEEEEEDRRVQGFGGEREGEQGLRGVMVER